MPQRRRTKKISTRFAAPAPVIRAKVSVELGRTTALTEAGADLLDQIMVCGSLSEAARRLGFAYRRAWLLVDAMNKTWPKPLVSKVTGGTHGGGTHVTEYGKHVHASYREIQLRLEHLLGGLGAELLPPD